MTLGLLFLALEIAAAAFLLRQFWLGIESRRVEIGSLTLERTQQPARYWTLVCLDFVVGLAFCAWIASALIRILNS